MMTRYGMKKRGWAQIKRAEYYKLGDQTNSNLTRFDFGRGWTYWKRAE